MLHIVYSASIHESGVCVCVCGGGGGGERRPLTNPKDLLHFLVALIEKSIFKIHPVLSFSVALYFLSSVVNMQRTRLTFLPRVIFSLFVD